MVHSTEVQTYWRTFLDSLPPAERASAHLNDADGFGDGEALSQELCDLVLRGVKTATCGSLWQVERDGDSIPKSGDFGIVTDWHGKPLCVIEYIDAFIKPFSDVDTRFAYDEGEDDRSLQSWRAAHWRYFTRTLQEVGREPTEDMPLVCQRFKVVFR